MMSKLGWQDTLRNCCGILEEHYKDMLDIEFTIEHDELFILQARAGRRTAIASLRIAFSLFCEGKINCNELICQLDPEKIISLLRGSTLVNTKELKLVAQGLPASPSFGDCCGEVAFSSDEAWLCIKTNTKFVYCVSEMSPTDVEIISKGQCVGVVTSRGGMTSHAAVACRGLHRTCIAGVGDMTNIQKAIKVKSRDLISVDGEHGDVYLGRGKYVCNDDLEEIRMLYKLLHISIKCNILTNKSVVTAWRLWDAIVYGKYFTFPMQYNSSNQQNKYVSFTQPTPRELETIRNKLVEIKKCDSIANGLFWALYQQLANAMHVGNHHKFFRPLLDPMRAIEIIDIEARGEKRIAGSQLTGVEFFNVNRYLENYIDIFNIKIYFCSDIYCFNENVGNGDQQYEPINFLDFTNPNGEGLVINTEMPRAMLLYVNDEEIHETQILPIYNMLRRRCYYWNYYEEYGVTRNEIIDYLQTFQDNIDYSSPHYQFCRNINLIDNVGLTRAGFTLIKE